MDKFKRYILHLFFPNRCACCDSFIEYNEFICEECKTSLPFTDENSGPHCGEFQLDSFSAPFYYKDGIDRAIRAMKFHGIRQNADFLACYMANCVKHSAEYQNANIIIPVPLHKTDRRRRGYNQSELIAKRVSKAINIPMRTDILIKERRTKKQHDLSYEERLSNLNGAFSVKDKGALSGKRIILIDDVFTTGSTMSACAKALKSGGAAAVYGLTASIVTKDLIQNG